MKFPKKYSQTLFIFFMGFGMSIIMSFAITYINTGMDIEFLSRWVKAWMAALPLALLVSGIVAPLAKKIVNLITD
jgi:hypothetical protein|tara:strand:+ start:809 stop:1033 length:225 start_codon:yes stop_codon:yes gene_type:complete